jgi:DNA-binding MarR family transcriptional regulator
MTESEEIVDLVFGVMGRFKSHFMEGVTEIGLTPPQAHALRHLAEPRSQRELAGCLGYDASNITGIIDRLEERGLVVDGGVAPRLAPPADRRVKQLVITAAGRDALDHLRQHLVANNPLVENLTADERRTFRDLLGKLSGGVGSEWLVGTGGHRGSP